MASPHGAHVTLAWRASHWLSAPRNQRPSVADLTAKQAAFVQEYLVDLNATQAAIRAGYSAKTAEQQGYQLLQKTSVAEAVKAGMDARAEKTGITAERVLSELALIGFANMLDYVQPREDGLVYLDMSALTREQAAAIQEVTVDQYIEPTGNGDEKRSVNKVKFKLSDKRAALVEIGKHLGMFKDRVEVTGKDGGAIKTEGESTLDLSKATLAQLQAIASLRIPKADGD
jgi:phage terminase small subunit